jgi:LysM repeat protein
MASWSGEQMLHTVVKGETLYTISQMYGIRLRALTRLNKSYKGKDIAEGQTIRLK